MGFGTARGFPKKRKDPAIQISLSAKTGKATTLILANPTYTTTVS